MSGSVRVQVTPEFDMAGPGWRFTMTCPREEAWTVHHDVPAIAEPPYYPRPNQPCSGHECDHCLCQDATTDRVEDVLERLESRHTDGAGVGSYLFDTLLGTDWAEVIQLGKRLKCDVIELALTWPYQVSSTYTDASASWAILSQLPWELIRNEHGGCLDAGSDLTIAVTRVVQNTTSEIASPLPVPPRVLFVVGTPVTDPAVRAGAEMLAIVREYRNSGYRIHYRIVEEASPQKLRETLASFRPEIVHFISHAEIGEDGRGYIELKSDEGTANWSAEQLIESMRFVDRLPPVVVLSACNTAGTMIFGPQQTAPLAAELVYRGIPVVVAMAGKISDQAARIFTRYFARALADRKSLVEATAHARRIAFAESQPGSVDWALPAIFFSAKVDPDVVRRTEDQGAKIGRELVRAADYRKVPIFCAREKLLQAFWAMLGDEGSPTGWEFTERERPAVLAVSAPAQLAGIGKTRLLQELAVRALENGHLPLLLGTKPDDKLLTLDQLAEGLAKAMNRLGARVLRIRAEFGTQLSALVKHDPIESVPPTEEKLDQLRDALDLDADKLRLEASSKYEELFGGSTRIIVLIDNLGRECDELLDKLFDPEWGLRNLGLSQSEEHPIPIVLVLIADNPDGIRHRLSENCWGHTWLVTGELKEFDPGGEDMLAYETVLLNPFRGNGDNPSGKPWIFNRDYVNYINYAKTFLRGNPSSFNTSNFDSFVEFGVADNILLAAHDNIPVEVV